jgi:ribosomal protein S18 acetylase RimI-like enzyme
MTALTFREATAADLPAIVAMLADDPLGAKREDLSEPLNPAYVAAFHAMVAEANQHLVVAEAGGAVVGTFQLSFIPGLSNKGAWRAQVEGVRVRADQRGGRIGEAMMEHAAALAREKGCRVLQLTTDKSRKDAQRFYERLGFKGSHEGYKLTL